MKSQNKTNIYDFKNDEINKILYFGNKENHRHQIQIINRFKLLTHIYKKFIIKNHSEDTYKIFALAAFIQVNCPVFMFENIKRKKNWNDRSESIFNLIRFVNTIPHQGAYTTTDSFIRIDSNKIIEIFEVVGSKFVESKLLVLLCLLSGVELTEESMKLMALEKPFFDVVEFDYASNKQITKVWQNKESNIVDDYIALEEMQSNGNINKFRINALNCFDDLTPDEFKKIHNAFVENNPGTSCFAEENISVINHINFLSDRTLSECLSIDKITHKKQNENNETFLLWRPEFKKIILAQTKTMQPLETTISPKTIIDIVETIWISLEEISLIRAKYLAADFEYITSAEEEDIIKVEILDKEDEEIYLASIDTNRFYYFMNKNKKIKFDIRISNEIKNRLRLVDYPDFQQISELDEDQKHFVLDNVFNHFPINEENLGFMLENIVSSKYANKIYDWCIAETLHMSNKRFVGKNRWILEQDLSSILDNEYMIDLFNEKDASESSQIMINIIKKSKTKTFTPNDSILKKINHDIIFNIWKVLKLSKENEETCLEAVYNDENIDAKKQWQNNEDYKMYVKKQEEAEEKLKENKITTS